MSTIDGLSGLKQVYNEFVFRNRLGEPRVIYLLGGDSIQAQPGAVITISADLILQMPAVSEFEPIQPSIEDLITAGLISDSSQVAPVPAEPTPPPATKPVKSVFSTGGEPIVATTGDDTK